MQVAPLELISTALRFLIVEDNPDDVFLLKHQLKTSFPSASFDVASSREELISRLSNPVSYDIVLSDWSLPKLDGLGVLSLVRRAGVDVPFILVSGKIGEETAIRAIREGVYDYILKDSPQRLPMAIQHALIQHSQEKRDKINNDLIALQVAALQTVPVAIQIIDRQGSTEWINEAYTDLTGRTSEEVLELPAIDFETETDLEWLKSLVTKWNESDGGIVKGIGKKKDNTLYIEERRICPVRNNSRSLVQFVIIRKDITSEEQEKKELELELFFSELTRETHNLETLCRRCMSIPKILDLDWKLSIQLFTNGTARVKQQFGDIEVSEGTNQHRTISTKEIVLQDELVAKLYLSCPIIHVFDQKRLSLLLFSHLERAMKDLVSQAKIQSQIKNISFLKLISRTISTYMDFETVMRPLLGQIREILDCDAVALFLVSEDKKTLICKAKNGYMANTQINFSVPFGEVIIGTTAVEGRIVSVYDFSTIEPKSQLGILVAKENFRAQHVAPIIVGGQVKGVLEVWFRREGYKPSTEWLALFDAIANQTGLALDYNELYENLQKAYHDLESSYEATIEGWSAAMDLRDEDTEGHSLRVTNLAENLGVRLGLSDLEISQIHKGALLHDIGKIGIPDSILKKPGPLTEEEWELMRKHPKIALDMLERISYLKDSLAIPLYHHERYDGTGYPFGLKGKEVPLQARLFAIVDVFDALICDRPYRKAWERRKIIDYLKEQKGQQFDPEIVDAFLAMIE
jgi:PAS domain S-box-containing protein